MEDGEVHPWDGDFEDYKDELVREIAAEMDEQVRGSFDWGWPQFGLAAEGCQGGLGMREIAAEMDEQVRGWLIGGDRESGGM